MRQLHVISPNSASQQAMTVLAKRPIAVKRQCESQIVAEQLGDASLPHKFKVLSVGEKATKGCEEKGSNGRGLANGDQLVEDLEVGVVARGENSGLQSAADLKNAIGEGELGSAEHGSDEESESRSDGDGLCENDVFFARFHRSESEFERHGVFQNQRGGSGDDIAVSEGNGFFVAVVHDQSGLLAQIRA